MSYSPAPRPIPTEDDFSVWGDDRIAANQQGIVQPVWLCEFAGSRADCLRYLDMALISDDHGHRMWGFAIYPPGENPYHESTKLTRPMTITELLVSVFGKDWEETTIPFQKK